MPTRRSFSAALLFMGGAAGLSTTASAVTSAAGIPASTIQSVFDALGERERRLVQAEALSAGLYTAAIDGVYGPQTESAIAAMPGLIAEQSGGKIVVPWTSASDVDMFLKQVASGDWSRWLYDPNC